MNSENNSSFSSDIPNLQIAWDSTSLGTFKECAYKYYLTMVLGRVTHGDNVHLTFGAHYHKALEIYDHHKSMGSDHDTATLAAVKYCYEATVVRLPGGGWRPWNSEDSNKNRFTLMRTVVWYLEQFAEDPLETIQLPQPDGTFKPAVELSFRYESNIPSPDGGNFWICGHIDRLVRMDDEVRFLDRKTSKNTLGPDTFAKFSPDNQMSLYDFSGPIIWKGDVKGGIIDAAQVAVTFSKFQRGFLRRTPGQREEWYKATHYWLTQAGEAAVNNYWPMNDKSCGNYGGCPFRPLCAKGPETRQAWINGLTKPRIWDPLKVRGDI
jgi:hypothetical protein